MRWILALSLLCLCSSPALAQTSSYFSDGVMIDRGAITDIYGNDGTYGQTYTPLPGGPTYYQFSGPGGQHRSGTLYTPQAPDSSQVPISDGIEPFHLRHGIYAPMDPWMPPGQRPHK